MSRTWRNWRRKSGRIWAPNSKGPLPGHHIWKGPGPCLALRVASRTLPEILIGRLVLCLTFSELTGDAMNGFHALISVTWPRPGKIGRHLVHRQPLPFGDWQQKRLGLRVIRLLYQPATVLFSSRAISPGMSLLTSVEYITHDPARRIALYRRCSAEDQSISGMGQNDARFSKITSTVASDLALLERRAQADGFQV
jgi:hypothetical protein